MSFKLIWSLPARGLLAWCILSVISLSTSAGAADTRGLDANWEAACNRFASPANCAEISAACWWDGTVCHTRLSGIASTPSSAALAEQLPCAEIVSPTECNRYPGCTWEQSACLIDPQYRAERFPPYFETKRSDQDCGNGTSCPADKKCSQNALHCLALDTVDCGSFYCNAGLKCGSGQRCLLVDSVDCGNGLSCAAGQTCAGGGRCSNADQTNRTSEPTSAQAGSNTGAKFYCKLYPTKEACNAVDYCSWVDLESEHFCGLVDRKKAEEANSDQSLKSSPAPAGGDPTLQQLIPQSMSDQSALTMAKFRKLLENIDLSSALIGSFVAIIGMFVVFGGFQASSNKVRGASTSTSPVTQMIAASMVQQPGNSSQLFGKVLKFFSSAPAFVIIYLLAMIPTYVLPYFGSNSGAVNALGYTWGKEVNPAFWYHLTFLLALVAATWFRSVVIDQRWLIILPTLALVFDLTPTLNIIPLVPTVMHLLTIILGLALAGKANPTPT